MRGVRSWVVRFLSLWRREQLDAQLEEELRCHLELQEGEYVARGMGALEARRAARRSLAPISSLEPLKEAYRARRGVPRLETLGQDLRYAGRMLRKSPGFTAVALLSLAFGIGTNCAIFSAVDALMLAALPVPVADRLVELEKRDATEELPPLFSYPAFQRLGAAAPATAEVIGVTGPFTAMVRTEASAASAVIEAGAPANAGALGNAGASANAGASEPAEVQLVSGNFFSALGVPALLGRLFGAAEDTLPPDHPVAVISYGWWQRHCGRDPRILGKVVRVNGAPITVIGVAPRNFFGVIVDAAPDLYVPLTQRDNLKYDGDNYADGPADITAPVWRHTDVHWLRLLARRNPGVSVARTATVLNALFQSAKAEQAGTHANARERADILSERVPVKAAEHGLTTLSHHRLERPLLTLMVVAALVLVIACVNLANLLLARADRRQREMAVRLGIGAGRGRLLQQLLTESLLLAVLGGALGLLFAYWGSQFLLDLLGRNGTPLWLDVGFDGPKLAFAAAVALLTCALFGLAPALQATRVDLAAHLSAGTRALSSVGGASWGGRWGRWNRRGQGGGGKQGGPGSRGGRRRLPLGRLLVVAQIALSLLLLVGSGLFVRSMQNLLAVDTGFERDRLVVVTINPRLLGLPDARLGALYERLMARLEQLPGVRSASLSLFSPLSSEARSSEVTTAGMARRRGTAVETSEQLVTPSYFATVGIPLLAGRGFDRRDRPGTPRVAVVNEEFARRYLPRGAPLGARFGVDGEEHSHDFEVVGVARNAKYHVIAEAARPMAYFPVAQSMESLNDIEVRVAPVPGAAVAPVIRGLRGALAEVSPDLTVVAIASMGEQVTRSLARERAVARLTGFFGGLALLLAAIGLYGVMSYSVARRTSEIGLRMALGAPRSQVLLLVLRETAHLVALGTVAGLAAAFAVTRLAASQLYGVTAHDPATLTVATLVLLGVALFAGFLPARRAADTDPMTALRRD